MNRIKIESHMILYKTIFQRQLKCTVCKCLFSCSDNFTALKSTILLPEDCVKCDQHLHLSLRFSKNSHVQTAVELAQMKTVAQIQILIFFFF